MIIDWGWIICEKMRSLKRTSAVNFVMEGRNSPSRFERVHATSLFPLLFLYSFHPLFALCLSSFCTEFSALSSFRETSSDSRDSDGLDKKKQSSHSLIFSLCLDLSNLYLLCSLSLSIQRENVENEESQRWKSPSRLRLSLAKYNISTISHNSILSTFFNHRECIQKRESERLALTPPSPQKKRVRDEKWPSSFSFSFILSSFSMSSITEL